MKSRLSHHQHGFMLSKLNVIALEIMLIWTLFSHHQAQSLKHKPHKSHKSMRLADDNELDDDEMDDDGLIAVDERWTKIVKLTTPMSVEAETFSQSDAEISSHCMTQGQYCSKRASWAKCCGDLQCAGQPQTCQPRRCLPPGSKCQRNSECCKTYGCPTCGPYRCCAKNKMCLPPP